MTESAVTYDPSSDQYHTEFSLDGPEGAADAIVFGIAEITDTDPIDLEPLGHVVDPEALRSVFQPDTRLADTVSVDFEYAGFRVSVDADETIRFEDLN